jgi:Superinfection immunity protein
MTFILLGIAMYFLPSFIGHNRVGAGGIFLLNFFLGWTVIGWVVALFWACTAEVRPPVMVIAGPARYCTGCGSLSSLGARYCSACGRPV